MIKFNNVSVHYGCEEAETIALNNVSFEITNGEFVTIIGKSGSGKTTLLNVLGGITKPTTGNYYFEGNNIANYNDRQISSYRNEKISFIVQHFALIQNFDVITNICIPLKYRRNKKIPKKAYIYEVMDKLGILDYEYNFPYELSGGEQQRVAICRSIISDTDIILADEPTGALDEENGNNIIELLKDLNKAGKTIIMVTHDLELAKIGNHRITMKDGKIVAEEFTTD